MNGSALSPERPWLPIVGVAVVALLGVLIFVFLKLRTLGVPAADDAPAPRAAFYESLSPAGLGPAFVIAKEGPVAAPFDPVVTVERKQQGLPCLVVEAFPSKPTRREP